MHVIWYLLEINQANNVNHHYKGHEKEIILSAPHFHKKYTFRSMINKEFCGFSCSGFL